MYDLIKRNTAYVRIGRERAAHLVGVTISNNSPPEILAFSISPNHGNAMNRRSARPIEQVLPIVADSYALPKI